VALRLLTLSQVLVLLLASSLLGKPLPKRDKQEEAEIPKEILIAKVPSFFYFDYPFNPHPGKRLWVRVDNEHFVERYPNGLESKFKFVSRTKVDGAEGTIFMKIEGDRKEADTNNDGSFQVFVPDRGNEKLDLRCRTVPNDWRVLGEMKKVE
jgi:hypothetical protein